MEGFHLLASARYIELNPVRAGLVKRPEDWPWRHMVKMKFISAAAHRNVLRRINLMSLNPLYFPSMCIKLKTKGILNSVITPSPINP